MMARSADLMARLSAPPHNNLNCLVTQWHTTLLELQSNQSPLRRPPDLLTGLRGFGTLAEGRHQSSPDRIFFLRPQRCVTDLTGSGGTKIQCLSDVLNLGSFLTFGKMECSSGSERTDVFSQEQECESKSVTACLNHRATWMWLKFNKNERIIAVISCNICCLTCVQWEAHQLLHLWCACLLLRVKAHLKRLRQQKHKIFMKSIIFYYSFYSFVIVIDSYPTNRDWG